MEEYIQIVVWREQLPYILLYPNNKFDVKKRKLLQADCRLLERNFLSCIVDLKSDENFICLKDCIKVESDGFGFDLSQYKVVETFIVCEY